MNERFHISHLLRPLPGGPQMGVSTVSRGSRQKHMKELASAVKYIKVGFLKEIDTSSLVSDWTLKPDQKEIFPEFKYWEHVGMVPHFIGKGHMWCAAFAFDGLLHTWASINCTSPLAFVIDLAKQYYENEALHRDVSHRLLFVMKTSWKESSYLNCTYEIFEP